MTHTWNDIEIPAAAVPDAELLGLLAHELNNHLTAIKGFCELANMDLEPDHPAAGLISDALDAGRRMERTVQELLVLSGRLMIRPEVCSLEMVCQAVPEELVPGKQERQVVGNRQLKIDKAWFGRLHEMLLWLAASFENVAHGQGNTCWTEISGEGWRVCALLRAIPEAFEPRRLFEPFYVTRQIVGEKGIGPAWWPHVVRMNGGQWRWQADSSGHLRLCATFPWSL